MDGKQKNFPKLSSLTKIKIIRKWAIEMRKYFESDVSGKYIEVFQGFPNGCCKAASILLLQWLYDKEGVKGAYGVANGHRITQDGEEETHFWIEIDNLIVDITADQFLDFNKDVFISKNREWHNLFLGSTSYPQSHFKIETLDEIYQKEYRMLFESLSYSF